MPRQRKGARLWLRAERRRGGRIVAAATWIILDRGKHYATGCPAGEAAGAERALANHIAAKYQPKRKARDIEEIDVAGVLSIYDADTRDRQANKPKFNERLERLVLFWGGRTLSKVTGDTCRAYVEERSSPGGARRDLEDLRSAINHHAKQGLHRGIVKVVPPPKGEARDRWLTRSEAARLIWTCWRHREEQTVHRGSLKGQKILTDKRPLRHLARFILIGLYTGTRAGAIAAASWERGVGRAYIDLERGHYYRLAQGKRSTKKRQPTVPLPGRLLAHLRRWSRLRDGSRHFVEWRGRPAGRIGEDRICHRRARGGPRRQDLAAHAPTHRGDMADAARRRSMGGVRISRHDGRDAGAGLRAPPPRALTGGGQGIRPPAARG